MPAIIVDPTSPDLPTVRYESGTKWVIDEVERLHIVGQSGNIASFNRNAWASVEFAPEAPRESVTCPSECAGKNHPGAEH